MCHECMCVCVSTCVCINFISSRGLSTFSQLLLAACALAPTSPCSLMTIFVTNTRTALPEVTWTVISGCHPGPLNMGQT